MSVKKPLPLKNTPALPYCPVCGTTSYSHTGIHPQCAARQFDADRVAVRKQSLPPPVARKVQAKIGPWKKVCPKCQSIQHFKMKSCACGHTFEVGALSSAGQGRAK